MITIRKLQTLVPSTRRRKIVRLLEAWLRGTEVPTDTYLRDLARLVRDDEGLPARVREAAGSADAAVEAAKRDGAAPGTGAVRAINDLRHELAAELGAAPADWDLLVPDAVRGASIESGRREALEAVPLSGTVIYLEAIRSPFNVGSIVRTAAAFGVPIVGLSDECPPVDHPRLLRSAMGAERAVTIVRGSIEEVCARAAAAFAGAIAREAGGRPDTPHPADAPRDTAPERGELPVIALELGGQAVSTYQFPTRGILVLGSEELGVSPGLLAAADARVSIQLAGAKASLNVGVACGIALASWSASLAPS